MWFPAWTEPGCADYAVQDSVRTLVGPSVEYTYSFLRTNASGKAHMILRLNDGLKAAQVFAVRDVEMLKQDEVDSL